MANYLRPKRGSQYNAKEQNLGLKKGEIFLEFPEGRMGREPGRIVIGDGSTSYSDMKYATTSTNEFQPFITDPSIYVPRFENTVPASTSSATFDWNSTTKAINEIGSGAVTEENKITLPKSIGAIKKSVSLLLNGLAKHESDIEALNSSTGGLSSKLSLNGGTMTGTIVTPADNTKGIIPKSDDSGLLGNQNKKFHAGYIKNIYSTNIECDNLKGLASTASIAMNASTADYASQARESITATTAINANNASTATYAINASTADRTVNSTYASTASYATNASTADYSVNASTAACVNGYTVAKSVPSDAKFTDNNNVYFAGTGLNVASTSGNNTTFALSTSGAGAGSYGMANATTGTNNTNINIPYITVDSYGRVTSISNKTYTSKDTTYSFSNSGPTLSWGNTSTVGTVGGTKLTVTMPSNPNTDKYIEITNASTSMANTLRAIFTSNATTSGIYQTTGLMTNKVVYIPDYGYFKVEQRNSTSNRIYMDGVNVVLEGTTWDGTNTSLKTALASVVTYKDFTCTAATVSANSSKQFATVNVAKTGYTPIAFGKYNTGDESLVPVNLYLESNSAILVLRNVSGSSISATPTFRILYMKSS